MASLAPRAVPVRPATRRSTGMASYDEILGQVPLKELAGQLGVDESEVEQAARTALPALLGGLQANAHDPAGAQSLASALSDHQGQSVGQPRRRRRAGRPEDRRQHLRRQHRPGDEPARWRRLGRRRLGRGGLARAEAAADPRPHRHVVARQQDRSGRWPRAASSAAAPARPMTSPSGHRRRRRSSRAARAPAADRCRRPGGSASGGSAGSNPLEDLLGQVLGGGSAAASAARAAAPATSWAASSVDSSAAASADGSSGRVS